MGISIELFSNEMNAKEYKEMMGYVCTLYNAYMTDDMRYGGRNFKSKIEKYNDWFSGVDFIDPDQGGWIDIDSSLLS